jgi:hypothetical protein
MNVGQLLLDSPAAAGLFNAKQTGLDWNALAAAGAKLLPDAQIWNLFRLATADLSISLCLHHVSRRSRDELTISTAELDAFVAQASAIDRPGNRPWLTISFDDGYEDAWHYIATRAPRFPAVEWLLFVCPAKIERQSGFRWDLDVDDEESPADTLLENERDDLRSVVRLIDAHLATVAQCRLLQTFDNVQLGNHTNCHFRATSLPPERAALELLQSRADFERIFGRERHFAFPFGGYGTDFDDRHVELLRNTGESIIWSTVARPHIPRHRAPGAVLPRFAVDGRWSASQIAFWIALRSLRARTRGLAPLCPAPETALDEESAA